MEIGMQWSELLCLKTHRDAIGKLLLITSVKCLELELGRISYRRAPTARLFDEKIKHKNKLNADENETKGKHDVVHTDKQLPWHNIAMGTKFHLNSP